MCSSHRTNAGQFIEPESQGGESSELGVEKVRLTIVDTPMSHNLLHFLANSFGMQERTLQHERYSAASCKQPLALMRTS